jgi:hypothetical protein
MLNQKTRLICLSLLIIHYYISLIYLPSLKKNDLYPFYDWDLFSWTPPIQRHYFVKVLAINGAPLAIPKWLNTNRKLFPGKAPLLVPHQINRLGMEISDSNALSSKALRLKNEFEQNAFRDLKSVDYQIVRVWVNWRVFLNTQVLVSSETICNLAFFNRGRDVK